MAPSQLRQVTSFTLVWIKMIKSAQIDAASDVTSFTLVWIKIPVTPSKIGMFSVTSFTLVWIKILASPIIGGITTRHELHARVD